MTGVSSSRSVQPLGCGYVISAIPRPAGRRDGSRPGGSHGAGGKRAGPQDVLQGGAGGRFRRLRGVRRAGVARAAVRAGRVDVSKFFVKPSNDEGWGGDRRAATSGDDYEHDKHRVRRTRRDGDGAEGKATAGSLSLLEHAHRPQPGRRGCATPAVTSTPQLGRCRGARAWVLAGGR